MKRAEWIFGLRPRAVLPSLVLAFGAGGCGGASDSGGSGERALGAAELERLVLTRSDLPSGYMDRQRRSSASARECIGGDEPGVQAVAARFEQLGFRSCSGRTFRKDVTARVTKHNTPGSTIFAFTTANAASTALPELRRRFVASYKASGSASANAQHDISVSGLGDESQPGATFTTDLGALGGQFDLYLYLWRRANVIVSLGSTDLLGDFSEQSTLRLARRLDARIAHATRSG